MMNVLIGIDRDDTLIYDDGSFPGSRWPDEEHELMPGVIEGLKVLRGINAYCVMISNQSGVARRKVLLENISKVNERVNELLNHQLHGLYFCEHPLQS